MRPTYVSEDFFPFTPFPPTEAQMLENRAWKNRNVVTDKWYNCEITLDSFTELLFERDLQRLTWIT